MNKLINRMSIKLTMVSLLIASATGCSMVGNSDKLSLTGEEQNESFMSYTQAYAPAKDALYKGKFKEIATKMNAGLVGKTTDEYKDELFKNASGLALAEKGLLSLNGGDLDNALLYFDVAEQKMGKVEEYSTSEKTGGFFKTVGSFLSGTDEISDYELRGFEKVMVLNYKALTYLLKGDRAAYNATRNAIDRQIAEREVWEAEKIKIEQEEAEKEKDANANEWNKQWQELKKSFVGNVNQYAKESAEQVRSAFVNPFGDYLNAVVMEFDSLDDDSITDNAQKAYSEVLKSNPKSTVAKKASESIKPEKNSKLVHIVWADGFAPQKQEFSMPVPFLKVKNGSALPYKYTSFVPNPSKVAKAVAKYDNKKIALEQLSNVESLLFKDEQDSVSWRVAQMFSFILRASLLGDLATLSQKPDTRSWLTLPREVSVARFYVPNKTKEISFETLDNKGKVISTKKVQLAEKGPTIIYAVSYDDQLATYHNTSSWIGK